MWPPSPPRRKQRYGAGGSNVGGGVVEEDDMEALVATPAIGSQFAIEIPFISFKFPPISEVLYINMGKRFFYFYVFSALFIFSLFLFLIFPLRKMEEISQKLRGLAKCMSRSQVAQRVAASNLQVTAVGACSQTSHIQTWAWRDRGRPSCWRRGSRHRSPNRGMRSRRGRTLKTCRFARVAELAVKLQLTSVVLEGAAAAAQDVMTWLSASLTNEPGTRATKVLMS